MKQSSVVLRQLSRTVILNNILGYSRVFSNCLGFSQVVSSFLKCSVVFSGVLDFLSVISRENSSFLEHA